MELEILTYKIDHKKTIGAPIGRILEKKFHRKVVLRRRCLPQSGLPESNFRCRKLDLQVIYFIKVANSQ